MLLGFEPSFGIYRSHTAGASRSNCLPIYPIGDIAGEITKPVIAYIAGFTAPAGKQMGHAGAIISGTTGTAAAKAQALEARGVRVGRTPTEVAEITVEVLGAASIAR